MTGWIGYNQAVTSITNISGRLTQLPTYASLASVLRPGLGLDAIYVHVPFCSSKCHYCDFYSLAGHLEKAGAYLNALEAEVRLHKPLFGRAKPRTVFIGGGTPTLLAPRDLERLLTILRGNFDLSGVTEFTVEANPNTFDAERAAVLAVGGVNRISFGAQSFHRSELAMLQRDHDPESVAAAFEIARAAGIENLNLDLIFGIPGQSLDSWEYSLSRALALQPQHISCYSLTYEANTPMTARMHRGDFQKIDEALELDMFLHVFTRLRDAGFVRYETSNFARMLPDGGARICQHNLAYWKAGNWLGLGPSAGSHVKTPGGAAAAAQWKNAGSLTHYCEALLAPAPRVPVTQLEELPPNTWLAAAAVFWLRLAEGLNFEEFRRQTGFDVEAKVRKVLAPFESEQFVATDASTARITDKGVPVSNHILERVLAAIEQDLPAHHHGAV